jgi:hypothetical protein
VTNETAPNDPGRDDAITPDEAPAAEPELPAESVLGETPATEAVEAPATATGDSRERLRALQDELRREREQVGKRREQDQRRRR